MPATRSLALPTQSAIGQTPQAIDYDGEANLFHFYLLRSVGKGAFGKVSRHPSLHFLLAVALSARSLRSRRLGPLCLAAPARGKGDAVDVVSRW